jgi:hypothetical protein
LPTNDAGGRSLATELAGYARQAEEQNREIAALVTQLSQAQFEWRPGARWSIGEHIEHLSIATRPYLKAIRAALDTARARGLTGSGPHRRGWIGEWFVRSMEPPPRMRVKTPTFLEPQPNLPREEVLARFLETQADLLVVLREANGVDLGRARMRSPFLKPLKLSVGQAIRVILAHNRRHLWHVRQVRTHPSFPDA